MWSRWTKPKDQPREARATSAEEPGDASAATGVDTRTSTQAADSRIVRVFISSTFRDMGAERDELVKRTFPALRKMCESRGVAWGEVDLRWGITDEQRADGQVLPICLSLIDHCRPYFIGLLGERYGCVPDETDSAIVNREPWLAEQEGCSVTELEILHGVLRNPSMAGHSFFYFRDPAYAAGRAEGLYRELPSATEIAELGSAEAERRADKRQAKLAALKDRIRSSGLPVRENYPDPQALGGMVLADISNVIDRLYPADSTPDRLSREASEHEAFAIGRSRIYVGRREYFPRLDAHATGDEPPMMVSGMSGQGKSALLASWALSYREVHSDDLVLMHFIGATASSGDWAAMLLRLIGELSRHMGLGINAPDEPAALVGLFANALRAAASKGRVVLVIDALDQLEDRDGALDLGWLPPQMPANVRLVMSSLPGRPLDEARRRDMASMSVEPLNPAEQRALTSRYLAQYSRQLSDERVERIAAAPQTRNPLFLRTLLDELRLWGEHETLDTAIDRYLAADSPHSLFELILARYEADYERDRPGLVGEAFALLWASRGGLSESELLDLLGSSEQPLPNAYWAPLYLAAEASLTSRSGLLWFFHDYLRQAVERRYLPTEQARDAAHIRLADYFADRVLGPRKTAELPWQLSQGKEWTRLADLLTDIDFLKAAWAADRFAVMRYWAILTGNAQPGPVDAYSAVLRSPGEYTETHVSTVADLLHQLGHAEQALELQQHLVVAYSQGGGNAGLQAAHGNKALALKRLGRLDEAMRELRDQERICREIGDLGSLQGCLGNQALILRTQSHLDEALRRHKEEEAICRRIGDRPALAASLGNQALILRMRGDLERALALHKEEEAICRQLGDGPGLSVSYSNQAMILRDRGDLSGAWAYLKQREDMARQLGDLVGLARTLDSEAVILRRRGELDNALSLVTQAEGICRELGDLTSLHICLGNKAMILKAQGKLSEALALHAEEERICRELGDLASLQACLGNKAMILKARGDRQGAIALLKEQEEICSKLHIPAGLLTSLGNQAVISIDEGEYRHALDLLDRAEALGRELGDPADLARTLVNKASLLAKLGRRGEAASLAQEACSIADRSGSTSLATQVRGITSRLR